MSIGSRFVFVSRIHRLDYTRRAAGHVEYDLQQKHVIFWRVKLGKQQYIAYYLSDVEKRGVERSELVKTKRS
jgi:hypothetical protein